MKRTYSLVLGLLATLACNAQSQQKPRAFVVDQDEWHASAKVEPDGASADAQPPLTYAQHTELIKTFNKACPAVTITLNQKAAEYVVVWDHKTWMQTSWTGHQNDLAVYNQAGDLVATVAAHKMDNAAKDACKAILKDAEPKNR